MKSLIKYVIILLAAVLVCLISFGIVLILGWPWWVGFFLLIGFAGLAMAAFIVRQILKKKKEQEFVSRIIEQDEAYIKTLKDDEKKNFTELQDRFREAINALKGSHLKKLGNPLYVLPWYMVLGESGSGKTTAIKSARLSSPFAEMNRVSGFSGTKNCDWWFFEQAIIIDTAGRYAIPVDDGRDRDEWQKFLNLLAKYRKKEPLSGLVVTVSADSLVESAPEKLEEEGREIKKRISELMRVLGSKFPVYVLVTKCDLIQGMTQFSGQLPEESLNQAFGAINNNTSQEYNTFIDSAMNTLSERLAALRLVIFHKPQSLDPALLLFPEEFRKMKSGLALFLKGVFEVNPYQETPMFRGLYFSSGQQQGSPYSHFLNSLGLIEERDMLPNTSKGLFLHDFFASILPSERGLFTPTRQALAWNRLTKNLGLMAWLAIGIAICGLLSFSFVRNLGIIRGVPAEFFNKQAITGEMTADASYMEKFRDSIFRIEKKNRSWWMPSFGLIQSREVEKLLKKQYCRTYDSMLLNPYDRQLSAAVTNISVSGSESETGLYAIHIVSRMIMVRNRINDDLGPDDAQKYALTAPGIDNRDVSGQMMGLYFWRLVWEEDKTRLEGEMKNLKSLLEVILKNRQDLHWVTGWVNEMYPGYAVTLKSFWGGSNPVLDDVQVAPAFTANGKKQLDLFLADMETAVSDPVLITSRKQEFVSWYKTAYLEAWHNFGLVFPQGEQRLKGQEEWKLAARKMGGSGPYIALIKKMAGELKPYSTGNDPAWMKLVMEIDSLGAVAAVADTGAVSKAAETVEKLKEKFKNKSEVTSATEQIKMPSKFNEAKALNEYIKSLAKAAQIVTTSRQAAFQAASQTFNEDPSKSPVLPAVNAFKMLMGASQIPSTEPFWSLVSGPVNFIWAYTCQETACRLQEIWEKEVLVEVQGISDPMQLNQLMFSPEGYGTKFIKGPAAPFVSRSVSGGYSARQVIGRTIPFEAAFKGFFSRARVGQAVSAAPSGPPPDSTVIIEGLPTETNEGATTQPNATHLELQCDQLQTLVNMNYPVRKAFTWSSQRCTGVTFTIDVGGITLTKNYSGPDAFVSFLKDFPGGSRTFSASEFPGKSASLRAMGIRFIKVHYRFSGHEAVLKAKAKEAQAQAEATAPGALPARIASCWVP
jgi:type VI secretion system protein ImpL